MKASICTVTDGFCSLMSFNKDSLCTLFCQHLEIYVFDGKRDANEAVLRLRFGIEGWPGAVRSLGAAIASHISVVMSIASLLTACRNSAWTLLTYKSWARLFTASLTLVYLSCSFWKYSQRMVYEPSSILFSSTNFTNPDPRKCCPILLLKDRFSLMRPIWSCRIWYPFLYVSSAYW